MMMKFKSKASSKFLVDILTSFAVSGYARLPLIGWPLSLPDDKVIRNVVELVDVFPTVSYLAGGTAPEPCPDVSFQV